MKKTLIWVGALTLITGVGLYFKAQYDLSNNLVYDYKKFKFNYISAAKATVGFDFIVKNKGALKIDVSKIDIDVYLNDVYTTRVFTDKLLEILPEQTTTVPLQLIVNPKFLLGNINQLAYGAPTPNDMRIKFRGKIVIKKLGIPIPIPFIYSTTYKELMG